MFSDLQVSVCVCVCVCVCKYHVTPKIIEIIDYFDSMEMV